MKQDNCLTALKFNNLEQIFCPHAYPNYPNNTHLRVLPAPNQQKKLRLSSGSRRGQAIVEYVLLVAICVVIFTFMFGVIRKRIFSLWVCEIYPRIGALQGCKDVNQCWPELGGDARIPECAQINQ